MENDRESRHISRFLADEPVQLLSLHGSRALHGYTPKEQFLNYKPPRKLNVH